MSWVDARLDEVADVILGQSPPGSSYNEVGEGVPFFQGKAEFGELRPTVRKWTTAGTKFATTDDVLLSVRAPVGPTNLAPSDCVIGRGLAAIRPRGDIESRYLLWALRATSRRLSAQATGSTFEAVTGKQVKAHSIPVAPLNEQRRIVAAIEEHLSRLDAADASITQANLRAEAFLRSSIADALTGKWPAVTLADVTESQVYGTSAKASTDSSGVPVLRMGNISGGRLDFANLKYLPADHPDVAKLVLEPGDILFNRTNSAELVGKSAVYRATERMTFASYLIRVRLDEKCDPHWATLVINSPVGRRYIASVQSQQVGQANVNGTKLAAMLIPLPPLEEQRRIVQEVEDRLSAIDALHAAIERAQRRSAALRRAVLERAFRGELVPQDPADEPAESLLARIRAQRPPQARVGNG